MITQHDLQAKCRGKGGTCQLSIRGQQPIRTHSRVLCFFTSSSVQLMMIVSSCDAGRVVQEVQKPQETVAPAYLASGLKNSVQRSQESSPGNGKEKGPTKARHPLHLPAWLGNSSKPRTAARHCLSARSESGPMKVAIFDRLGLYD